MDKNTAIKDIDPEVKRRINYLVHKTENCDGDIPIKDLEIAYEYASMNIKVMEESKTPMIELLLLKQYPTRICDMKIVSLYNTIIGRNHTLSKAEVYRAVLQA